jgi:hypothetical protein
MKCTVPKAASGVTIISSANRIQCHKQASIFGKIAGKRKQLVAFAAHLCKEGDLRQLG